LFTRKEDKPRPRRIGRKEMSFGKKRSEKTTNRQRFVKARVPKYKRVPRHPTACARPSEETGANHKGKCSREFMPGGNPLCHDHWARLI